jgi:hypothetical protein
VEEEGKGEVADPVEEELTRPHLLEEPRDSPLTETDQHSSKPQQNKRTMTQKRKDGRREPTATRFRTCCSLSVFADMSMKEGSLFAV